MQTARSNRPGGGRPCGEAGRAALRAKPGPLTEALRRLLGDTFPIPQKTKSQQALTC
jgi:hypothetical protein